MFQIDLFQSIEKNLRKIKQQKKNNIEMRTLDRKQCKFYPIPIEYICLKKYVRLDQQTGIKYITLTVTKTKNKIKIKVHRME